MSVVRPSAPPPAAAASRFQLILLVAAGIVVLLFLWLILRYVGAGSDADAAAAERDGHADAGTSLARLDSGLVSALKDDPAKLFRKNLGKDHSTLTQSILDLSGAAQVQLRKADDAAESSQLKMATDTFVLTISALPTGTAGNGGGSADTQVGDADGNIAPPPDATEQAGQLENDKKTATAAAVALRSAAAAIGGTENSAVKDAIVELENANSTRRSTLTFLVLLFALVGAIAVAFWGGLIRPPAQAGGGSGRHEPTRPRMTAGYPPGATGPSGPPGRDQPFNQDDAWAPSPPSTGSISVAAPPAYLSGSAPEGQRPITRTRSASPLRSKLAVTTSAHPGTTLDAAEHAGLAVFAGSMIGPEHRAGKNVAPREDAYGWAPGQDSSVIAVAVADGVGSARNSHAASLIATEMAIAHLRQVSSAQVSAWFERPDQWDEQASTLMATVASYLGPDQVDARARMIEPSTSSSNSGQRALDPATTLVIALGVVGADGVRVLWASVGDSQVSVLAPGAAHLSWTQDEGDSPSGTRALPRDTTRVVSSTYLLPPGHAFLLITDGCEKVLTLDPSTVGLLHELVQRPGDVAPMLELLQRNPRGAGDDRTIILFAPVGGTP